MSEYIVKDTQTQNFTCFFSTLFLMYIEIMRTDSRNQKTVLIWLYLENYVKIILNSLENSYPPYNLSTC